MVDHLSYAILGRNKKDIACRRCDLIQMLAALLALVYPLRQNMTLEDWEAWVRPNNDIPFFCMLWAPWCHYCRDIHPTWIALQEEYADDETIMLGAVDCVAYRVCEIHGIHLYPTFVEHYKGQFTNTTDENKTVEIFQYLADRLIEKRTGDVLKPFPDTINVFPSFVFQIRSGINYSVIHILKRAAIKSRVSGQFYLDQKSSYSSQPKVIAYIGPHKTVEYNRWTAIPELQTFLMRNANTFEHGWSMKSLTNRKYALFVSQDSKIVMTLQKLATKFPGRYVWASARPGPEIEHYFGITTRDLPAVLVVDGSDRSFAALLSVHDPRAIERFLLLPGPLTPMRPAPHGVPLWAKAAGGIVAAGALAGAFYWFAIGRRVSKQE